MDPQYRFRALSALSRQRTSREGSSELIILERLGTMRTLAGLTASGGFPSFQSSSGAFRLLCPLEPFPFLPPPVESVLEDEEEGAEALGSSRSEAGLRND